MVAHALKHSVAKRNRAALNFRDIGGGLLIDDRSLGFSLGLPARPALANQKPDGEKDEDDNHPRQREVAGHLLMGFKATVRPQIATSVPPTVISVVTA